MAVISITAVFGENGLIKRAEEAKNMTEEATRNEEQAIANAVAYMNEILGGSIPDEPEEPEAYVDSVIAEAPKLSEGMTPVKWNGSKWVKTTADDNEWYNYAEKKWANVVLGDATFTTSGSEEILDESKTYSMLVWIPRYAYQITSQYHQNGSTAGNINIVFIDTNNQNKDKSKTYSESYPSYSTGSGMSDYVVHPAFNYGDTEETKTKLAGIWVGKYETSNTNCTTTASTGEYDNTDRTATIRPNVTSWRSISISNIYTVCTELNKDGNPYGLNSSDTAVDPHLMKNSEWGAVAYLSQNGDYGKGSEVWINNSSTYITGNAGNSASESSASGVTNAYNTTNGQNASTTGNTTGVYDMSGGASESVAAYVNNGHSNLTTNGSNLVNAAARYKEVYQASSTSGSDSQSSNYGYSTPTNGKYGDAVYETSNSHSSSASWYSDGSNFPYSNFPFFSRGGNCDNGSLAGLFIFNRSNGSAYSGGSFRVVLTVM